MPQQGVFEASSAPAKVEDVLARIHSWTQKTRPSDEATVVTIPFIIGNGVSVISTGVQACIPIFFRGRIIAIYLQEFDGITGSITLDIQSFRGGVNPTSKTIIGAGGAIPTINQGRYYADELLGNWAVNVDRGDYLLVRVSTVSLFTRLSVALAFRRK